MLKVLGIERVRCEAALAFPIVAFGREDSINAHFFKDRFNGTEAAINLWAIAKDGLNVFRVGKNDHRLAGDFEYVSRPKLLGPFFELSMQTFYVELEQVAEQRQTFRSGKITHGFHFGSNARIRFHAKNEPLNLIPPTPCFGGISHFDFCKSLWRNGAASGMNWDIPLQLG